MTNSLDDTKRLFFDGDSFSMLLPDNQYITAGHIISERLGYNLDHYGFSGKTPSQIFRTSMRYAFEDNESFMCIGIGSIYRDDFHTEDVLDFNKYKYKFYQEEHCSDSANFSNTDKGFILKFVHGEYIETNIFYRLIALHDFLMYNNVNFIIHNLGSNFYNNKQFLFASGIYEQIEKRPRIVNFYENSLHDLMLDNKIKGWDYDRYGNMAHPDEEGHAMYADFLWDYVDEYR